MKTKQSITPGIWKINSDDCPWTCGDARTAIEEGEELGHTEIFFSVENDEQEPIAYFPWEPFAHDERAAELRANAKAFAALPDLIAALQAIQARIKGEWDNPALVAFGELSTYTDHDVLRIAGEALAKAGIR